MLIAISIIAGLAWLLLRKKDTLDLSTVSLDNVESGGVILVKGNEYLVEQKNRYTEGGEESFELKLTGDGGMTFWLKWGSDRSHYKGSWLWRIKIDICRPRNV